MSLRNRTQRVFFDTANHLKGNSAMSVGLDPNVSLGAAKASVNAKKPVPQTLSNDVTTKPEGQQSEMSATDGVEISEKALVLSQLSEVNREQISAFREKLHAAKADGSFDPEALAAEAPEVLKQFAESRGLDLAMAIDIAANPEQWIAQGMPTTISTTVTTAVSIYSEVSTFETLPPMRPDPVALATAVLENLLAKETPAPEETPTSSEPVEGGAPSTSNPEMVEEGANTGTTPSTPEESPVNAAQAEPPAQVTGTTPTGSPLASSSEGVNGLSNTQAEVATPLVFEELTMPLEAPSEVAPSNMTSEPAPADETDELTDVVVTEEEISEDDTSTSSPNLGNPMAG